MLKPAVLAPNELGNLNSLHIIQSGTAIHAGRILRRNEVWGEDMLLASVHLRSRTLVRAISYVEVFFIARETLLGIAAEFPETAERVRRRVRTLAMRRFVVLIAKVSLGLGQHQKRSREDVSLMRERLGEAGKLPDSSHTRGRFHWQVARNLYQAQSQAEKSFMRKHLSLKATEQEQRMVGMLRGSAFDQVPRHPVGRHARPAGMHAWTHTHMHMPHMCNLRMCMCHMDSASRSSRRTSCAPTSSPPSRPPGAATRDSHLRQPLRQLLRQRPGLSPPDA